MKNIYGGTIPLSVVRKALQSKTRIRQKFDFNFQKDNPPRENSIQEHVLVFKSHSSFEEFMISMQ